MDLIFNCQHESLDSQNGSKECLCWQRHTKRYMYVRVCIYIYINCITILSQDTPYNKLLKYQSFTCLNIPRESVVGMKSDVQQSRQETRFDKSYTPCDIHTQTHKQNQKENKGRWTFRLRFKIKKEIQINSKGV